MNGQATTGTSAPLRLVNHVIPAVAIVPIAFFTALAWPFAILTGIVIGKAEADRRRGVPTSTAARAVQFLAVTGGVLAMLFFGAILGGLIAFLIVALAAFSERLAADYSPSDRMLARILLVTVAVIGYVLLAVVLNLRVDIRVGT